MEGKYLFFMKPTGNFVLLEEEKKKTKKFKLSLKKKSLTQKINNKIKKCEKNHYIKLRIELNCNKAIMMHRLHNFNCILPAFHLLNSQFNININ